MNAAYRQMYILSRLTAREPLEKAELADHFDVSPRTIQRDVSQLNVFFDREGINSQVVYDHNTHSYALPQAGSRLSDRQLLAIIKVLLATRALNKTEMAQAVAGLRAQVSPERHMLVNRIIENERRNFTPLHHEQPLIDLLWDFSNYILTQTTVAISYTDRVHTASEREIIPKAIFFSETYFYVIATDLTSKQDRFFRCDRIANYYRTNAAPLAGGHNPYNESDLRQKIQFMYAGDIETIRFEFFGIVEAALDRLPTARVVETRAHSVIIEAEVYGHGIQMWLLSQGNMVRVISPQSLVDKMIQSTQETLAMYAGKLGEGSDVPHFSI